MMNCTIIIFKKIELNLLSASPFLRKHYFLYFGGCQKDRNRNNTMIFFQYKFKSKKNFKIDTNIIVIFENISSLK